MRSSHPNRSSSQSRTLRKGLISRLPPAPHKNFLTAHLHFEQLQGARRGPGDVFAIQVVVTVVAGAPHVLHVIAILDRAREMGAGRRHGAIFSAGGADEYPRSIAEAEDLAAVWLELSNAAGHDRVASQVGRLGWNQVLEDGVDERRQSRQEPTAEQRFDDPPAGKWLPGASRRAPLLRLRVPDATQGGRP